MRSHVNRHPATSSLETERPGPRLPGLHGDFFLPFFSRALSASRNRIRAMVPMDRSSPFAILSRASPNSSSNRMEMVR